MGKVDYFKKIHTLKKKIAKLERKKRFKEKKEKNIKRRERARKLLQWGIIFEITSTEVYQEEVLIGYLENLQTKNNDEIEYYNFLGNRILNEINLENYDKKEVYFLDTNDRKKRNHKLISMGALFETTKTDKFNLSIKIGYLEQLHSLNIIEMKKMEINGKNFIKNRRK